MQVPVLKFTIFILLESFHNKFGVTMLLEEIWRALSCPTGIYKSVGVSMGKRAGVIQQKYSMKLRTLLLEMMAWFIKD